MYFVYMVRCADNSQYSGIAADLSKRMREHANRGKACAKYTRSHPVSEIDAVWTVPDKSAALKLERALKALPKNKKLLLCLEPHSLGEFISSASELDWQAYRKITLEECLSENKK